MLAFVLAYSLIFGAYYVGMVWMGWFGHDGVSKQTVFSRFVVNPTMMTLSGATIIITTLFALFAALITVPFERKHKKGPNQ